MLGCLMDWDELLQDHLDTAKITVTNVAILKLYHQLMQFMGKPSACSANELEQIANFKAPQDLEKKMKDLPSYNIYHDLFKTCSAN